MIPITSRNGQRIALFGLGGSGLATAQALVAGGAEVIAHDDNPQRVEEAASLGIGTGDLRDVDFAGIDALVLSPGVPLTHPHPHWSVDLAKASGTEIVGDVGLFAEERKALGIDAPFVAITGTNGKSTTTALLTHVLKQAGRDVQMGGNIGKPVLSLEPFVDGRIFVVEVSSYQIDLAPVLGPGIGILLNLAPDHLDRHGTMENYAAIKARLVETSQKAIVGNDDEYCRAIAKQIEATGKPVTRISEAPLERGCGYDGENIICAEDDSHNLSVSLLGIETLQGTHNGQNASAVIAACLALGLSADEIQAGLRTFSGLAHRMEILGKVGDVTFVNDSKATNADAAAKALSTFDPIYWIAGGLAKEGGIEQLKSLFDRVTKAYLIGEAAPGFAAVLGNDVAFEISGTLDAAVIQAAQDASDTDNAATVLLSPACASFDQFANFEIRGEAFRAAVSALDGFTSYGEHG